jgi:hypothetical protein
MSRRPDFLFDQMPLNADFLKNLIPILSQIVSKKFVFSGKPINFVNRCLMRKWFV